FGWEQAGAPAAEEERASTEAVGETRESTRHIAAPRVPPHFADRTGVAFDRPRRADPEHRKILNVLGEKQLARLEHEDTVAVAFISVEQVLCDRSAEAAAAQDHD